MQEPQVMTRTRGVIDLQSYRFRSATEADFAERIETSTVVRDAESGRVSIVYLELDDDCRAITDCLKRIEYREQERTSGMKTRSRIFGFRPRITIRDDFCTVSSLARDSAQAHALITSYAKRVATYYERYNPELYSYHEQQVEKVLPDWTLERSVFTSGIINKNNPLAYHFDAGNFKHVWSNMLVFRAGTSGGLLSVPEYNFGIAVKNNSLVMFDGQNLLHGVTPIAQTRPDGYRYSIVYYSLQSMWKCLPLGQEMQRIRQKRTEREEKRLQSTIEKVQHDHQ